MTIAKRKQKIVDEVLKEGERQILPILKEICKITYGKLTNKEAYLLGFKIKKMGRITTSLAIDKTRESDKEEWQKMFQKERLKLINDIQAKDSMISNLKQETQAEILKMLDDKIKIDEVTLSRLSKKDLKKNRAYLEGRLMVLKELKLQFAGGTK